jgi:two-component system, cell cycle sensor histidine kinase and response regulator CckA
VDVAEGISVFSRVRDRLTRTDRTAAPEVKKASPKSSNVLVVDDEEPVRKFVERVLRDAGYKTAMAGDGLEALDVAAKLDRLDILVTDVMMSQMAGSELARRLRQSQPTLKVLYLTGYADNLFKEKVTLWEDEAYLDKPCSIKSLLEAVSLLLFGSFEAPRELNAK